MKLVNINTVYSKCKYVTQNNGLKTLNILKADFFDLKSKKNLLLQFKQLILEKYFNWI